MAVKKRQRVSEADKIRLGPEVAAAKAKLSPQDWKSIVKSAHARGFTVAGVLSGAPDPLKERTRSSLVSEAQKTISTAYAPATAALSQQESSVKALDAKRQADEAHFQEWLTSKQQAMATQAMSADAALAQQQDDIQKQTQAGYQQAQQQAQTNAAVTPGNVSDPSQSNALNLSADAQRANDNVAAQRQASASMTNNARGYFVGAQGVSAGLAQQAQVRRASDTNKALSDIGADRADLLSKSAAAAAEEIARLFGAEANKADANRNYSAAAQKLGLDQLSIQQRADAVARRSADAAAGRRNTADIAARNNTSTESIADANNKVDLFKTANANERARLDRALKAKLASKGRTASTAELRLSNDASARVSELVAMINELRAGKKKPKRPLRDIITGRGASSTEYELALDIAVNGKPSKLNQQRAKQLGILNPEDL